MAKYKFFENGVAPHHCQVYDFDYSKNFDRIFEGLPCTGEHPKHFSGKMNRDSPENTISYDYIHNLSNLLIVSDRVKEFFSAELDDPLEFLSLQIVDHHGMPIAEKYWVVNVLEPVVCIDYEQSTLQRARQITSVEKLVLDKSKIPSSRHIFKVSRIDAILLSKNLIARMEAQGFTNMAWVKVKKFRL